MIGTKNCTNTKKKTQEISLGRPVSTNDNVTPEQANVPPSEPAAKIRISQLPKGELESICVRQPCRNASSPTRKYSQVSIPARTDTHQIHIKNVVRREPRTRTRARSASLIGRVAKCKATGCRHFSKWP